MLRKRTTEFLLKGSLLLFCLAIGVSRSAAADLVAGFQPSTPDAVRNGAANLVGHYSPAKNLRLSIILQPPHPAEEQAFLKELQTRGGPQFHHFLTADEWNARFGPSVEDEQAVVAWAQSHGLEVTHRYPNRLIVDVAAPVTTIEKAFGVTINSYQANNRSFFSNDRDPQLPANLVPAIQAVIGLDNNTRLRPANKNVQEPSLPDYTPGPVVSAPAHFESESDGSGVPQKPHANGIANITGGAYDPSDIYSSEAYDYNALYHQGHCCNPLGAANSPPEASIAVATVGSQNFGDIVGFHDQYPYLAWNITEIGIDGQSVPCNDASRATCDGEGTMDMEWTTATANSFGSLHATAQVFMYDANNFNNLHDAFNQMLTDGHARVASTSWSCTERYGCPSSFVTSLDSIFSMMVGQGWTLVAAQGDRGATDDVEDHLSVAFPGSDPNFVSAGGTTLTLDSFGNYVSEVTWTGGPDGAAHNDGGTGGGCSAIFTAPPYQSGVTTSPCGTGSRGVPDIALNADWYNTPQNMYMGGLGGNGGTSIVAPELAGFFAQENAYLLSLGNICNGGSSPCAPMGNINYFLYDEGKYKGAPHFPFYDITSGCNDNDITSFYHLGYYCAGTGWDAVTGWGSANMLQLAWAVNWYHVPGYTTPRVAFTGPATGHWYNSDRIVSWTISAPPNNSYPSEGLAGFSQAWDYDPGNPTSAATPGYGNSFYSGPEYANGSNGCLDFTGASCLGWVGQGWHTVNIRAWGNEGETGYATYGPLGYDSIAPSTSASLAGTLFGGTTYKSAVTVKLTAVDPGAPTSGSGVSATWYQVNSEGLRLYTAPFAVSFPGTYTVTFHSVDVAGNIETTKSTTFSIRSVLSLSVASIYFGNQAIGTTSAGKSATVSNIGSTAVAISSIVPSGDFVLSAKTCGASLAAGASCTLTSEFKPSIVGLEEGAFTINYAGEGTPQVLTVSGNALMPVTLSPTSYNFGSVAVGSTSAAKAFTLTNNESAALTISPTVGGDFSIASTTCGSTLASLATCTINVTFKPKQNGGTGGALSAGYNGSFSPQVAALGGNGTGGVASPLTFSPASLAFSNVAVGISASNTVIVKNSSASPVTISAVAASGDYTASGCVGALAPLGTCTMTVTFKPTAIGTINGSVALTDNTIVSPEVYNLSGGAVSPLSLSATNMNFGTIAVGTTSAAQIATLTNNLASALALSYPVSGDYAITGGTCSASLAAHTSCTLFVSFSPKSTGAIPGVVTVSYAGAFSPEEVKLTGIGQ